jgi:hypothetical protein
MRKSLLIPLSALALVVGFAVSAVGQSHAHESAANAWCTGAWICNAQATDPAQPVILTQWWIATGTAPAAPASRQMTWQSIDHGQLALGSTFTTVAPGQAVAGNRFTDAGTVTSYPPAANGCAAQVYQFRRTFTPMDSYTYTAHGISCPMAGQSGQTTSTGTIVITGGTGIYKGASGTGTYAYIGAMTRNKAGGPREITTATRGQMHITLAVQ